MSATHRADPISVDTLLSRCRFPPAGTAVECAVSGGADSTALLVLAVAAGLNVTAVHVDHGLRPGSAAEADVVAGTAAEVGAGFEARSVAVAEGPNLEARAREARAAVLAPAALTGHTLDDQAETVLMFLLRGTGPDGIAGIDPCRRPLLQIRRTETRELCARLGLRVIDDPSNDDPRFLRNRVRHELLPLMDELSGRDTAPLLARTASLQRRVLAVVDDAARSVDPTDARAVAESPEAVAAAALRNWWRSETAETYAPDAAALDRMLSVARGEAVATDVHGGWRVARSGQRLRLVRVSASAG